MATKSQQILLSFAMLAGAAAVAVILFLNRPTAEIQEPVYTPVTIDVAEAVKQSLRVEVQAQGTVSPMQESALIAEVSGRIIEVSPDFMVGGFVSKGDVLLRIDPRDYQTNLLRAQAAVEQAESALIQEKGRADVALREWKKLPKGSQRSEDAKNLYLRKPQLELADAQLRAAMADLNTARDNLERTIIRAPYDALIREKYSDLGQFVSMGSQLAEVFSVTVAEVRLPIPQSRLPYLELPGLGGSDNGAPIDLYTDVGGVVKHWTARVHRTEGTFDERSRALYTVARIEDPYAQLDPEKEPLRMGTFVNANIQGREIEGIITLPRYILRAGNLVWVVDENQRLRNRKVTMLRTGGDLVYVSAGLDEGDLVSLTTLDSSFNGAEVSVLTRTPSNELQQETFAPGDKEQAEASTATAAAPAPTSAGNQ